MFLQGRFIKLQYEPCHIVTSNKYCVVIFSNTLLESFMKQYKLYQLKYKGAFFFIMLAFKMNTTGVLKFKIFVYMCKLYNHTKSVAQKTLSNCQ